MKVGIIGCGLIARSHIRILKKLLPEVQISLYDIEHNKAIICASEMQIDLVYSNPDDLFSSEKPNSVHILTPPSSHAELAKKAILANCHVLIEKPVTTTSEEYINIYNLAQKHNRVLCVDYSILGMPIVLKAKEEISSGRFGRLIAVHCNFGCTWPGNSIPYGDPNHWAYFLDGGILENMADHPASIVLDMLDPIEDYKILFSRRNILPYDCPDLLHVSIRNQNQIGSFTLSMGHGIIERRAHFFFENGSLIIDLSRQLYSASKGSSNFINKTLSGLNEGRSFAFGTLKNIFQVITGKLQRDPGIVGILENYYNCILSEGKLLVSHETVLAVTNLLENVWKEINYSSNKIQK